MENISNREVSLSSNNVITGKCWFFWTIVFIIIDYGRPQDILPIGAMRPAMVISLILVYFIVIQGKIEQFRNKQTRLIVFFVILLGLHVPFAVNNHFALITFINMAIYVTFILSVIASVNTLQRLKKLIFIMLLLMAYISLYGLANKGVGSGSYFLDENDLSLYLNMYLPFCFFLMMYDKRKKMKLFYSILLAIGLTTIVVSSSRGGFVGLVAIGLVIWLISDRKLFSIFLIIIAGCILYFAAGDVYLQEIKTVTETDSGTALQRIESWKSGWRMFLDNPLGVGGNNFPVRFPEYQSDYFERGMWGTVSHSLWFTLIPELGIPGIIIYLLIIYNNIKDAMVMKHLNFQQNEDAAYIRALSLSIIASLAGFFASGSFLSVLYYAHFWYTTAILVAMVNISREMNCYEWKITGH